MNKIKQVKRAASQAEVELQIGKNGLTTAILDELKHRLVKHPVVKVKLLKNCELDTEEVAKQVESTLNAVKVQTKGFTVTFQRKV